MNLTVPINQWTIATAVTVIAWVWLWSWSRKQHGDYNFGPAIMAFVFIVGVVALWGGLLLGVLFR